MIYSTNFVRNPRRLLCKICGRVADGINYKKIVANVKTDVKKAKKKNLICDRFYWTFVKDKKRVDGVLRKDEAEWEICFSFQSMSLMVKKNIR